MEEIDKEIAQCRKERREGATHITLEERTDSASFALSQDSSLNFRT